MFYAGPLIEQGNPGWEERRGLVHGLGASLPFPAVFPCRIQEVLKFLI